MRILVVEDEKKLGEYLKKAFSEQGFAVDLAAEGETGMYLAQTVEYEVIILDIMLPHWDGWDILKEIRRLGKHTPVLFLTARDAVADKVKGFALGGDDYLVKPFAFSELLARTRSLLRRGPPRQTERFAIEDLEVDVTRHKAMRGGKALDLTPKEFALLILFLQRMGDVISRTTIAEQVWDMNFDGGTNVVDVAVGRLRKKVDDPFRVKLIHTVRGIGYVLEKRNES